MARCPRAPSLQLERPQCVMETHETILDLLFLPAFCGTPQAPSGRRNLLRNRGLSNELFEKSVSGPPAALLWLAR